MELAMVSSAIDLSKTPVKHLRTFLTLATLVFAPASYFFER